MSLSGNIGEERFEILDEIMNRYTSDSAMNIDKRAILDIGYLVGLVVELSTRLDSI